MRPSSRGLAALVSLTLHLMGMGFSHAQEASKTRRSGAEFMSPDLQAMQRDDALNPGMLWVKQGHDLWQSQPTASSRSCGFCS